MSHRLVYVAGDAEVVVDECANRLARLQAEGFDVEVAAPNSPAFERLEALGISTRPLPGGANGNVASWLASYFILQGEFLESPPTLVHGHEAPWAWIAAFAARQAKVPAVFATIDTHRFLPEDSRLARFLQRLPNTVATAAPSPTSTYRLLGDWVDGYLVHDEDDLEQLLAEELVPPSKLELVLGGNGVDLSIFDPRREDAPTQLEARSLLDVPTGYRDVIGVPAPSTDAGRKRLSEIQGRLRRTHPSVGWILVGESSPSESASVARTSPNFFRAIDCYLDVEERPKRTNLMRASAMKVPVVVTRGSGTAAVVVDYETGRVAEPEELQATLLEVLADPKRAKDMGVRARARAEQRFDRHHIDEQLLRIYDRVLSRAIDG